MLITSCMTCIKCQVSGVKCHISLVACQQNLFKNTLSCQKLDYVIEGDDKQRCSWGYFDVLTLTPAGTLVDRIQDTKGKKLDFILLLFFDKKKIHKQVGKLEAIKMADAQSTGHGPLLEITARWRCRPLIKNMTAHYNSQFCVSFHHCFHWEA